MNFHPPRKKVSSQEVSLFMSRQFDPSLSSQSLAEEIKELNQKSTLISPYLVDQILQLVRDG
jgi:hypothetical protein